MKKVKKGICQNIIFIPIDNRPVTYLLADEIAGIDKNLKLFLPERNFLGGLFKRASADKILDWLKNVPSSASLIILSLDTIAYGGLISSRRCNDGFCDIKNRLDKLKENLIERKKINPDIKIFAFSSIMRISNNNNNEEEKEYWNLWGEKIFSYSFNKHKAEIKGINYINKEIPDDILNDYLETRKRNFNVNKIYLEWLKSNILDFMIYSKDDTGKYGFNVLEADILNKEIKKENLNAVVKTGADEIPLGLLLRGITGKKELKINVQYTFPQSRKLISKYEDISVRECIESQIKIGIENAIVTNVDPDITLFVNNFENKQGDLVFKDLINEFKGNLPDFKMPYIIADINNANGSDNGLLEVILKKGISGILSYSAYNTSANTIGSALCAGVINYLSKKTDSFNENCFKKFIEIRLLDDWAYQANIREEIQNIKDKNFERALNLNKEKFKPFEEKIKKFTGVDFKAEYNLPWKRSFEIEISIK